MYVQGMNRLANKCCWPIWRKT